MNTSKENSQKRHKIALKKQQQWMVKKPQLFIGRKIENSVDLEV